MCGLRWPLIVAPLVFALVSLISSPAGGDKPAEQPAAKATPAERALDWLVRHQSATGAWKCRDFKECCKQPCENKNKDYGDGKGWPGYDIGVTGLAILAFAAHGHTHAGGSKPEYTQAILKGVEYLKTTQVKSKTANENGRFGADKSEMGDQWIYNHAIATYALAELLAATKDSAGLKECVKAAAEYCLETQNPGKGWQYGVRPGQNDTSVTGWMVLALASAKRCPLEIPANRYAEAFSGAKSWLDSATSVLSGRVGYQSPGDPGSQLMPKEGEPYAYSKELSAMTSIAMRSRLAMEESSKSPVQKRSAEILVAKLPEWREQKGKTQSTLNFYYWYHATYALKKLGGGDWDSWKKKMSAALLPNQRTGGDENGSWDPIDEWGAPGGRVYTTALGALILAACAKD